jgi:hypothetical protein
VRLLALRPLLAYCASLGWWWRWLWRSRWNVDWQGKRRFSEKTCPSATFVHHKIPHNQTRVWTPGRRGGKPATNRLSYGAALTFTWGIYRCGKNIVVCQRSAKGYVILSEMVLQSQQLKQIFYHLHSIRIYLSVCLSVCLSVRPSLYLSTLSVS